MVRRVGTEAPAHRIKQKPSFRRNISTIRKRLRELRRMHGLSYRDLEKRSGVHERQIITLETGDKPANPTIATLTALADALGIELYELIAPAQSGVRRKKSDPPARARAKEEPASNVTRLR
jgi:transcriptional regulator with XRE-family HTH domain